MQLHNNNIKNTFGCITKSSKKLIKEEVAELKRNNEHIKAGDCISAMKRLDKKAGCMYRIIYNGDAIILKSNFGTHPTGELVKGFFFNTSLEKLLNKAIRFIERQEEKSVKQNTLKNFLKKVKL